MFTIRQMGAYLIAPSRLRAVRHLQKPEIIIKSESHLTTASPLFQRRQLTPLLPKCRKPPRNTSDLEEDGLQQQKTTTVLLLSATNRKVRLTKPGQQKIEPNISWSKVPAAPFKMVSSAWERSGVCHPAERVTAPRSPGLQSSHLRAQSRAGEIGSDTAHPGDSLSEDLWEVDVLHPCRLCLSSRYLSAQPASPPACCVSQPTAQR
ncbi:hypothetical protein D4764_14G0009530 [Takifugu flavidus]|uniref:Uncharacterized protein n=1 Tax=Takifugu flavidus TaxID=433684 RepID=A0A5C6P9P4_9TELE|nr:hypothetical protein D4764_14G0009530 [Takifugu flavidus]